MGASVTELGLGLLLVLGVADWLLRSALVLALALALADALAVASAALALGVPPEVLPVPGAEVVPPAEGADVVGFWLGF